MRCTIHGDILIILSEDDRRNLEEKRILESDVETYAGKKRLHLYLDDEVPLRHTMEERGFRVDFDPPDSDIESRAAYLIRIDRAVLSNLVSKGYATSRWGAGLRLDFNY